MTFRTRIIVLFVVVPATAFAIVGGFLGRAAARDDAYRHLRIFEDVVSLIENNYVEEINLNLVIDGALRGLADGLDPDSSYLSADQVQYLTTEKSLLNGRVGLELTRQYYLQIIATRDDSPAADAGLRPGDYVREINEQPTRNMSVFEGTRLLRGTPGSALSLTVLRGNSRAPHEVKLIREKLITPQVTGWMAASDVGYLRIAVFDSDVTEQITTRIDELIHKGAQQLIVDLRQTAEGPLDAGLDAARLFVTSASLAIREERGVNRETILAGTTDGEIRQPLVILVNTGTAGAAELFTAGLIANDRAKVVGGQTLGRTALQKLVDLPDGSGLLLSSVRFLTTSGTPIHQHGLQPDVVVNEPNPEFGSPLPEDDPMLKKALELLTEHRPA